MDCIYVIYFKLTGQVGHSTWNIGLSVVTSPINTEIRTANNKDDS